MIWLEIVAASSALFKNQVATESHGPIPSPLATVKGRSFSVAVNGSKPLRAHFSPSQAFRPKGKKSKSKKEVRKIAERILLI